jgi:flagellar motor protein MotB
VTPPDLPQTKLDWIRDALKWVASIAAGLLALSATYFYDRFNQSPRLGWMLWLAWVLLTVAAVAATCGTLAAWKNLGRTSFGKFLTWGYNIGMWSFAIGFLLLAVVLMTNIAVPKKMESVTTLIAVAGSLPVFEPASAAAADPQFQIAVCAMRAALADSGSRSALVVGRFDQRELSGHAQSRFASNFELAQRRADQIGMMLSDSTRCRGASVHSVIALAAGPRHPLPTGIVGAAADALLAEDRRVEVYGFKAKER